MKSNLYYDTGKIKLKDRRKLVENFCLSISEKLLIDAINFAKSSANITEQDLSIIMQSRKILLFQNSEPSVKKIGNENFDIPMGC